MAKKIVSSEKPSTAKKKRAKKQDRSPTSKKKTTAKIAAKKKISQTPKKNTGGTNKTLTKAQSLLVNAFKDAYRARILNEKSEILYKQNKCHFQIGCGGHEVLGVAFAKNMIAGKDWFFPYYRDMALCTGLGMSNEEMLLNILSKKDDPNSGGRQMPMHYGHKKLRIVNQSSPTGTQFLQAVGAAMAIKSLGTDEVVYVSSGEGTTAQGAYHEALNWAAREKLPIIFVIQDNKFAISVHISEHIAGSNVESISSGYEGLEVSRINGLDFEASSRAAKKAVQRARSGQGGSVIIADVVRLGSHSISDNQNKYRSSKAIAADLKKDPLIALEKLILKKKVLSSSSLAAIKEEIFTAITQASIWAEKQENPDPLSVTELVLAEVYPSPIPEHEAVADELFMVDAINRALHEEMKLNEQMIVYGQDVGYGKGGVFSVTQGLTDTFGEKRCFNSPLAEDSIIGTAVGLSAIGYKPVVEIQFGDYIWTAMMQIRNELSMMYYRSNGSFNCPTVVRVAVGGYIRGGPYHSQNIEATFAHFPGLVVIYPSNAYDAKGLLKTAIRGSDPVLFLEHKGLYRQVHAKAKVGGADDCLPIGKAKVVRKGEDATIITWGAMVQKSLLVAEKAQEEMGRSVEVIDIRTISPFDSETVLESVRKTSKAIVIHEDMEFMGFGAEIAAQIGSDAFAFLDAPVSRIGALFTIVPQSPILEAEVLPSQDKIWQGLRSLLEY